MLKTQLCQSFYPVDIGLMYLEVWSGIRWDDVCCNGSCSVYWGPLGLNEVAEMCQGTSVDLLFFIGIWTGFCAS